MTKFSWAVSCHVLSEDRVNVKTFDTLEEAEECIFSNIQKIVVQSKTEDIVFDNAIALMMQAVYYGDRPLAMKLCNELTNVTLGLTLRPWSK